MPVETVALTEKPIEQTSEYIASLKSRRSTTIQPQVEGFLTRIAVRSGEHVRQGALLFEIDSRRSRRGWPRSQARARSATRSWRTPRRS